MDPISLTEWLFTINSPPFWQRLFSPTLTPRTNLWLWLTTIQKTSYAVSNVTSTFWCDQPSYVPSFFCWTRSSPFSHHIGCQIGKAFIFTINKQTIGEAAKSISRHCRIFPDWLQDCRLRNAVYFRVQSGFSLKKNIYARRVRVRSDLGRFGSGMDFRTREDL